MLNPVQIEHFTALAENGSFKEAANVLYCSQPAVSKQISLLEQEVGVPLFIRKYGSVELTPAGKIMYDYCMSDQMAYQLALQSARKAGRFITGHISIGISEKSMFGNLNEVLSDLIAEHQEYDFNVEYQPMLDLSPVLAKGKYDIVVALEYSLTNKYECNCYPLMELRHTVCISKKHPLIKKGPVSLEDLKNERFFFLANPGRSTIHLLDRSRFICAASGIKTTNFQMMSSMTSVLLATAAGLGVAILDESIIIPEDLPIIMLPTKTTATVAVTWHKENGNPAVPQIVEAIFSAIKAELPHSGDNPPIRSL